MSRIRSSDTVPEQTLRSILHEAGFRFRLKGRKLPGRPDVVLPRYRAAVFVHGCFWHRHVGCTFAYTPRSNIKFWKAKFAENVQRDRLTSARLRRLGWRVITVWECQIEKHPSAVRDRLTKLLNKPRPSKSIPNRASRGNS